MSELIKIFKNIGILSLIIAGLTLLGSIVNSIIPWQWLTNFFVIIRNLLESIDFLVATDTLITLVTLSLIMTGAYWTFKGTIFVISKFKD